MLHPYTLSSVFILTHSPNGKSISTPTPSIKHKNSFFQISTHTGILFSLCIPIRTNSHPSFLSFLVLHPVLCISPFHQVILLPNKISLPPPIYQPNPLFRSLILLVKLPHSHPNIPIQKVPRTLLYHRHKRSIRPPP